MPAMMKTTQVDLKYLDNLEMKAKQVPECASFFLLTLRTADARRLANEKTCNAVYDMQYFRKKQKQP